MDATRLNIGDTITGELIDDCVLISLTRGESGYRAIALDQWRRPIDGTLRIFPGESHYQEREAREWARYLYTTHYTGGTVKWTTKDRTWTVSPKPPQEYKQLQIV